VEGDAEHCAHVGVGGAVDEEDEASGDVVSVLLVLIGGEDSSAMVTESKGGDFGMRSWGYFVERSRG
jgi:hypothetical protein